VLGAGTISINIKATRHDSSEFVAPKLHLGEFNKVGLSRQSYSNNDVDDTCVMLSDTMKGMEIFDRISSKGHRISSKMS